MIVLWPRYKSTVLDEFVFWLSKFHYPDVLNNFFLHLLPNDEYKKRLTRCFVQNYTFTAYSLIHSLEPDSLANRIVHISGSDLKDLFFDRIIWRRFFKCRSFKCLSCNNSGRPPMFQIQVGIVIRYKNGFAIRYKKGPSIRYIGQKFRDFFLKGFRYNLQPIR